MAKMSCVLDYTNDIRLCPVCLEDCRDPRSLPCLHTFCLRCIDCHCEEKLPGDEVECPVCREEFEIPEHGVGQLRRNFFVERLVSKKNTRVAGGQVQQVNGQVMAGELCDGCKHENEKVEANCLDGKDQVASANRVNARPGNNDVCRGTYCDIHVDELLKAYCTQCDLCLCTQCYVMRHFGHTCIDISESSNEFSRQIAEDVESLTDALNDVMKKVEQVDDVRQQFVDTINATEMSVRKAADEMKRRVDREADEMLQQLEALKSQTENNLVVANGNVYLSLIAFESFVNYSQELISKGNKYDISRAASELHSRAVELQKPEEVTPITKCLPEVAFMPSDVTDGRRLVGSLSVKPTASAPGIGRRRSRRQDSAKRRSESGHPLPLLTNELTTESSVRGVTQLDDKIFVVCRWSDRVKVFGANCERLADIRVREMKQAQDIVACHETQSLYLAGWDKSFVTGHHVWRITVDGRVNKFLPSSSFKLRSLSVTSGRLLVTSPESELLLYGPDGQEMKRVSLPDMSIQHAVETPRGSFIACHHGVRPQVVEVDADGHVIRVYNDQEFLGSPCYLSFDAEGRVLVADSAKQHVLLLTGDLQLDRILLDREHNQLIPIPFRLCFVQSKRQLIVGCCDLLPLFAFWLLRRSWTASRVQLFTVG